MEEMRQLIGKRGGEMTPLLQHRGQKEAPTSGTDAVRTGDFLGSIEDAVSEADKSLVRAASNQEALAIDIGLLIADLREVSLIAISLIFQHADCRLQKASLLEKSRMELQSTKRQCELVKSLLADATAENEMMYQVGIIFFC
jgi:protein ECT2